MRFSDKQRRVLRWWLPHSADAGYDAVILDGAVRAGKTLCMGLGFCLWAMCCFENRRFGLCGKTISSLRRNVLEELLPLLRRCGFQVTEKRSENRLTLRHGATRNDFYLFGGRDEGAAALIQGVTFAGVLLDEVVLMPRSFVEQACARCSVAGSRLWFSCNPASPGHWFYQEWVLRAQERRALYLHFTMADNPALSPEIRARYERLYKGVFYRRFVLGEWVAAEGRVYDFFDPERDACDAPAGEAEVWCVSCDYGTVNPASFGLWGLYRGVWYRVREFYFDSRRAGRQMTDAEYVRALLALAGGRTLQYVVVDPSAASFLEALRRAGVPVRRADNDVLAGIRLTADLLKAGRLRICRDCRDCLREIAEYVWDTRGGSGDRVRKEHDHAMDDLRYFAASLRAPQDAVAVCSAARVVSSSIGKEFEQ